MAIISRVLELFQPKRIVGKDIPVPKATTYAPESVKRISEQSRKFFEEDAVGVEWSKAPETIGERMGAHLANGLQSMNLGTLSKRLDDSPSNTARYLGYALFNDPTATRVNVDNAAYLLETYENLAATANGGFEGIAKLYQKQSRLQGNSIIDTYGSEKGSREFNNSMYLEMNERALTGKGLEGTSQEVAEAADIADAISAQSLAYAKGDATAGERAVAGMEDIPERSGYVPRRYSTAGYKDTIAKFDTDDAGRAAVEEMVFESIQNGYRKLYDGELPEGFDTKAFQTWSKAVVRQIETKRTDINRIVSSLLDTDSRAFAKQVLLDNNVKAKEADKIVDYLARITTEKGMPSFAKRRIPMDMSVTGKNGIAMTDIVDTNVSRLLKRYTRETAGRAALARWGLNSEAAINDFKMAIKREQATASAEFSRKDQAGVTDLKLPKELSDQDLDDIFSFYRGGTLAGGVNPWVFRARTAASLSALWKLGITQGIETGVTIASVGIKNYVDHVPLLKKIVGGKSYREDIMRDLNAVYGTGLTHEHRTFMDDDMHEILRDRTNGSRFLRTVDSLLLKGQRVQGYLSLYYKVAANQRATAAASMSNEIARGLKTGDTVLSEARWKDLGVSGKIKDDLTRMISDFADFAPDGRLRSLNVEDWPKAMQEQYFRIIKRHVDTVVQRSARGETDLWMHKDVGTMLLQWRNYTLLAQHKQLIRALRHSDIQSVGAVNYGLATAAMGYIIRVYIDTPDPDERVAKLQLNEIARATLAMSSVLSGVYDVQDPIYAMLGLDHLRAPYNRGGIGAKDMGSLFPSLGVLSSYPDSLRAVSKAAFTDKSLTRGDWHNIKTASMVGNMLGFSYFFNTLKPKSRAAKRVQRERETQQRTEAQQTEQPDTGVVTDQTLSKFFGD